MEALNQMDQERLNRYLKFIETRKPSPANEAAASLIRDMKGEGESAFRYQSGNPITALSALDSVSGAPFRTAVQEMQKGDEPGSVAKALSQVGTDPAAAPSWGKIAENAGVENKYAKAVADILGGFAEPGVPGLGVIGSIKKSDNVVDIVKLLKERKAAGSTEALARGAETGKLLDARPAIRDKIIDEELGPKARGLGEEEATMRAESKRTARNMVEEGLKKKAEREAKKAAEPRFNSKVLDSLPPDAKALAHEILNRHDKNGRAAAKKALVDAQKAETPYVSIKVKDWNSLIPNFSLKPTGKIGDGFPVGYGDDPFLWADTKYGVSKNLLGEHMKLGKPVEIHTGSDLIAREDYLSKIPKGSTVTIYMKTGAPQIDRMIFPGHPSDLRLERAIKALKDAGHKVNIDRVPEQVIEDVMRKHLYPKGDIAHIVDQVRELRAVDAAENTSKLRRLKKKDE